MVIYAGEHGVVSWKGRSLVPVVGCSCKGEGIGGVRVYDGRQGWFGVGKGGRLGLALHELVNKINSKINKII